MTAPETTHHIAPIPGDGTLLHVGMPKSGTTAIQFAAAKAREELARHSVVYPGKSHNHSYASFAVARRRRGWSSGAGKAAIPPMSHWDNLVAENRAAKTANRVFISHEFFAERDEQVCRKVAGELGPDVRVVFTLRNQPSILASAWQEYLKTGIAESFEKWLDIVLRRAEGRPRFPSFERRTALFDNVAKWAKIVGPENTTVIVLDPDDRDLLPRSFEQLLALPAHTLATDLTGREANRSLTRPEADTVREVNARIKNIDDVRSDEFRDLHKLGGISQLLVHRAVPKGEPAIMPPRWAAEYMAEQAAQQASDIRALGVDIIGDLANLASLPDGLPQTTQATRQIPIDIAAHLETGTFEAGHRAAKLARRTKPSQGDDLARDFITVSTATGGDDERFAAATALTNKIPTRILLKVARARVARAMKAKIRRR